MKEGIPQANQLAWLPGTQSWKQMEHHGLTSTVCPDCERGHADAHLLHLQRWMNPLLLALSYGHFPILCPTCFSCQQARTTLACTGACVCVCVLYTHLYRRECARVYSLSVTTPAHFHKHVYQICDEVLKWFHFGNYGELIFIGEQEGSLEANPLCLCAGAQYLISDINRQAVHSMKGSTSYRVPLTTRQDADWPQACC